MAITRILVLGDTHVRRWSEVHPAVRAAVAEADIALHCGDSVRGAVIEGFRAAALRAVAVHGNSDPPELRRDLPFRELLEVDGVRIGVTHPAWGAEEFEPRALLSDFGGVEGGVGVICYGHLHEPVNEVVDGVLFLNGGQPYPSFLVPATVAWLVIEDGVPRGEIVEIAPAE